MGMDHVVFPVGLTLVEEGQAVLVSFFGWDDRHGMIATLCLDELLKAMETVSTCSSLLVLNYIPFTGLVVISFTLRLTVDKLLSLVCSHLL